MQKLLIPAIIFLLLSCSPKIYHSKVNTAYRPLSTFKQTPGEEMGADTADYIKYNFIKHKEKYIGKKFKYIYQDLKLNIVKVSDITDFGLGTKYVKKFDYDFYDGFSSDKSGVYYSLIIKFKDKVSLDDYYKFPDKGLYWSNQLYAFFKDRIVEDIAMSDSRKWNPNWRKQD